MYWQENDAYLSLRGACYEARVEKRTACPRLLLSFDGQKIGEFPLVSALDRLDEKETLRDIRFETGSVSSGASLSGANESGANGFGADEPGANQPGAGESGALRLTAFAQSNLWTARTFEWTFHARHVTYRHTARGQGRLGRCFFLASGRPGLYDDGDSAGYPGNAAFFVPRYRTFNPNLANIPDFDISQPGYAGIGRAESMGRADYVNIERYQGLFSPAPLAFAFFRGASTMSVGLGAKPGEYRFGGLEYTGSMKSGAAFYVQYLGYTRADGAFASPELAFHFGYDPYDCLQKYVDWIDENGYGTAFRHAEAPWHREPVFCGWAEQTATCPDGMQASQLATQENYERWIAEVERRGIPAGVIVIDDKWQKHYGRFEVDEEKWPDMPGFVRRQHEKGRHVLLWIPAYQTEGIPEAWCARDASGKPVFASPGLPEYDAFLREQILRLVRETDIDGFKEDWIGRTAGEANFQNYGAFHGIEMLRRFQKVVYDALHEAKPDALMETQTPNPLLRESSDILRLNDIWFATRDLPEMMRARARIARIAGWKLFDCDNASSTVIDEWFDYARLQTRLGVPALYFLTETESAHDPMTPAQSDYLAALWRVYRRDIGLKEQ